MADAAESGADVVVDLTEVGFMDASTLGVLVCGHKLLDERARRLILRGARGLPRKLIDLCELAWLIEGADDALPAERGAPTAIETWVSVPLPGRSDIAPRGPERAAASDDRAVSGR